MTAYLRGLLAVFLLALAIGTFFVTLRLMWKLSDWIVQ